ncbi:uncharacterized protein EV154DRAFT_556732 [Mucor mucedo]|uniref:uncharacterized protein n=1 Tax=Mucor mucedo TaxID=29922 RepID=UPI00221F9ED9|nr:uncharacterized protein EV154DRAFT_556732 [Mucor mucedo]KAI7869620.1 hypothetical protein EV154DRAFT_556732 [Mucor mucedo]
MEELYDYSQHKYCLIMDLEYDTIVSSISVLNRSSHLLERIHKTNSTSILYQTNTGTVIAKSRLVTENRGLKRHRKGVIHIRNIFDKLATNDSKFEQLSIHPTAKNAGLFQGAITVLQTILQEWQQELNATNMDFYYAFIIPANWEYKIRKELIQPLFVKAGCMHENNGQGRLLFFSKLESLFESMQIYSGADDLLKIKHGKQYILCTLNDRRTYSLDIYLISAQYPAFTSATGRKWVPQILKQGSIEISYGLERHRSSLITCLEKHCNTTLSSELIGTLLELFNKGLKNWERIFYPPLNRYLSRQPFKYLKDDKFDRFKKEEIRAIRLLTLKDILDASSISAEKVFKSEMRKFLEGTSNIKTKSMLIFHTIEDNSNVNSVQFPALIEKWSKSFSEEQHKSFETIKALEYNSQDVANMQLVTNQMKEFSMRRNPVILPMENATEQSKNCLKPISFVNIDISPTQIKTIFTYLDKDRQIKQTQNIECNMQPLTSFITTQSHLYHRPILHITNRMKLLLEKTFDDYLKLYSTYNIQSMIITDTTTNLFDRLFRKKQMKLTLGNIDRIKTSQNSQKEIRKLFVSSNPNLFKQLTKNLDMDDFFASKDKFRDAKSESFTTCHPGYIYFFMITYLHCLNKRLSEKLANKLGRKWRGNHLWYGVSIDKNLLDTVFGSKKNLEKLFYAGGILQQDDTLRKLKTCTRGEEILPAIQQRLLGLNFRLKSCFVVAQIFSNHIQLSLHQTVKLSSTGDDAASIIIQDEVLHIEDVYDTLCKNVMKSIQANNCQVKYCSAHRNKQDKRYNFETFETYSNIYPNLKPCLVKLLEQNRVNLDMNSKIQMNMNSKCACNITIFLRDIIEVCLVPVVEIMATDIVASLTNKMLFGNYVPNYIFVFGDPFNLTYGSKIHTVYTMIMQKAMDDGIHLKEKDTKAYILRDSIFQLLELFVQRKKPYLLERFVTGTLCQVSSETFAVRLESFLSIKSDRFVRINSKGVVKNIIEGDGSYLVFIQKGKPISKKGLIIKTTGYRDPARESDPRLKVLQLGTSIGTVPEKYTLLFSGTTDSSYYISCKNDTGILVKTLVLECEQMSNSISIKLSKGCLISVDDYIYSPYYSYLNIIEPLTLAYI